MAKQGKGKPKAKKKAKVSPEGDLETIEAHVKAYVGGKTEAASILTDMGRDAAHTVMRIAKDTANEALEQFARRLAAIPPQVETNMHDLRRKSVRRRVETERKDAPKAFEATGLTIAGGALAVFDPQRVLEDLATGGRPRQRAERLEAGDIACLGLHQAQEVPVRFFEGPAPDGKPTARLRLRVESGMVFVGPPEASDGPRMGTVRLDPFATRLDELAPSGRFLRFPNGILALHACLDAEGEVCLYVGPDAEPEQPLGLSPLAPLSPPRAD